MPTASNRPDSVEHDAQHGVTLEQYAGITASVAEEFALDAALANERITAAAWRKANRAWKILLGSDGSAGPLFSAFQRKQVEAEDWLGRSVAPLDDALPAWIGFLHAYGAHPAPSDLLAGAGLRLTDMARLQRRWSRRFEEDASLEKQAAEIATKGPGPVPQITVGPAVLRPFPWSPGSEAPQPEQGETPPAGAEDDLSELPLDRYAALRAELDVPSVDRARAMSRHGLDEARFAVIDTAWRRRLQGDPDCARDYRRLLDHQRARLRAARHGSGDATADAPQPLPPIAARGSGAKAPRALGGTSLALDVPRAPALPFVEGSAEIAAAPRSSPPRAPSALGGTSLALDVPRGPALPFSSALGPSHDGAASGPKPVETPPRLGGTSLALDVPRGDALPFSRDAPPAVAAPSEKPAPRSPSSLGGTSLALDVPRAPALPFAPVRESDLPAPKPKGLAESRVFDLSEVLRRRSPSTPPPPVEPKVAELTIEQYASLCVELAAAPAPAHAAATLARYRLTIAERERIDRHFGERFAREPGLRAAWERACAIYREWLAAQARR